MQDIIRLLPDALANQIAAGEVVQRPSSVVKELMENSIDAGATVIELIIGQHGKSLIQVVDNGKGMSETDARICFERHATSKITRTEDLFNIRTMGFRGEALASIAAVAQVDLKTQQVQSELGTHIQVDSSEVKFQEPCAGETGTNISVKNLFYNVPARRNFLKSDGVEMKHIIDEFQHIALSYPDKTFILHQDEKELFRLPPGKLSQRIIDVLGKNFKDQLVACSAETPLMKLTGYIGKPESSKKSRGDQFLFVNNRFIKSNYLNHAITTAYDELIPEKYTPFYALFMEMDPEHLDINVHPTKTEVKFDDERTIYAVVRSAVKQALGAHNIYPALDFTADVNIMKQFESAPPPENKEKDYTQFRGLDHQKPSPRHWETLFDENLHGDGNRTSRVIQNEGPGSRGRMDDDPSSFRTVSSRMNEEPENSGGFDTQTGQTASNPQKGRIGSGGQILQLHNEYIISPVKSGLMVIHTQSAMERILYEQFLDKSKRNKVLSQRCLFPAQVEFTAGDFQLLSDIKQDLEMLGFEFEFMSGNTIVIHGIPADIADENEKELIEGVLEQYKSSKNDLELSVKEKIIRSMAKRSASNNRRHMDVSEMEELINRLFSCQNVNYTPTGKQTFRIIDKSTLENLFK